MLDDKDRLSIFDKNGLYLATKKVGKNNPKAQEIKADNEIRMEWNRAVDRAIVGGASETEIVELKKTEITEKVKKSIERNDKKPELFGDIVRAAIALLERLIAKVMQKKISFPVNRHRKGDLLKDSGQPQLKGIDMVQKSKQTKMVQNPVTDQPDQAAEKSPQPKPSVLAGKYPRLKEIDSRLKEQNNAIFELEKRRDKMKKELSEYTGIFKSSRRKELQQEIDGIDIQISNMKKGLSSIVREYKFDSVQAFYKEFNAAKCEYLDYKAACAEYERTYGDKVTDTMSIIGRLR